MTENRYGKFANLVEIAIDLDQVDNAEYRIPPPHILLIWSC